METNDGPPVSQVSHCNLLKTSKEVNKVAHQVDTTNPCKTRMAPPSRPYLFSPRAS